jgi:F0F1-type ATP synthase membrane subunit b/b'
MKTLALTLLYTLAAQAAEEGGHAAGDDHEIWWKWLNFAILFAGLGYVFVKSGLPFFKDRAAGIVKDIADASKTKADAETRAADLERRIANLSGEIEQMRTSAKSELEAEGRRIQSETQAAVAKAAAQAENEIASATKAARQELSAHAAQLALGLAAGKLRNNAGGAQPGLLDAFVRDLEKMKN